MSHIGGEPNHSADHRESPHHVEDDYSRPPRGSATAKLVTIPTLTGLVIGILFVTVFLAAFHAPEPHNLPVGIVGAAQQVKAVEQALDQNAPGQIEFTTYDSAAEARNAIEHRTTFGAYVMAEDGRTAQLLYAGANGPSVTGTLEGIFGGIAQHSHATLTTRDVVPASSGDTRGLGIFYAGFGIVLGAFLFGLISTQMGRALQLRWRLLSLAMFSVVGGAAVALIGGSTGFNVLPGNLAANMSVIVLLAAAVSAGTLLFLRIGGPAGTLLASLVMLILGNATSGGVMPAAYLPDWLRPLADILPAGLGLRALFGESYFNNDGFVSGLILLAVWVVASLGIVSAVDFLSDRRKARALRSASLAPAA
ncbi:ABC transporter permease [Microlunatus elymi]|nr:ABC transporter permease [Microlunatus elymi]